MPKEHIDMHACMCLWWGKLATGSRLLLPQRCPPPLFWGKRLRIGHIANIKIWSTPQRGRDEWEPNKGDTLHSERPRQPLHRQPHERQTSAQERQISHSATQTFIGLTSCPHKEGSAWQEEQQEGCGSSWIWCNSQQEQKSDASHPFSALIAGYGRWRVMVS